MKIWIASWNEIPLQDHLDDSFSAGISNGLEGLLFSQNFSECVWEWSLLGLFGCTFLIIPIPVSATLLFLFLIFFKNDFTCDLPRIYK